MLSVRLMPRHQLFAAKTLSVWIVIAKAVSVRAIRGFVSLAAAASLTSSSDLSQLQQFVISRLIFSSNTSFAFVLGDYVISAAHNNALIVLSTLSQPPE